MPTPHVDSGDSGRIPGRRVLLGLLVLLVLGVIPAIVMPLACRQPDPELMDYGVVPPFHLVDERGQPFTEAALRGQVTIVSFIFTRCDTLCPVTSMKMAHIQEQTFDVGNRIKLVSFSVDPTYDTPERLAAYAKRYRADPQRWRFVTGPADAMKALVTNGFMSAIQHLPDRPNGVPNIAHAGYFMLVDPALHIRGRYDSNDVKNLDKMMHAARFLARTMH